jgi:hypothetical protein
MTKRDHPSRQTDERSLPYPSVPREPHPKA